MHPTVVSLVMPRANLSGRVGIPRGGRVSGTTTSFLEVRDLAVHFRVRKGLAASRAVKAVDGVSFDLMAGQTLGIAGESGSGKSTVARTLVRIVRPTGGTIAFDGGEIADLRGQPLKRYRTRMQMVYQDPYDSLDPPNVRARDHRRGSLGT